MTGIEQAAAGYMAFIEGTPAPQGSKKVVGRIGQRARLVESSAGNKPWRAAVKSHVETTYTGAAHTGPVDVSLCFYLARPASVPVARRPLPIVRPDLDKLCRSVLDGLTDGGLLADDSVVVSLGARKLYADPAGSRTGVSVDVTPAGR